jgi:hypothetical protein
MPSSADKPIPSEGSIQFSARFQRAGVNPCQSCCSAIGDEQVPAVGNITPLPERRLAWLVS